MSVKTPILSIALIATLILAACQPMQLLPAESHEEDMMAADSPTAGETIAAGLNGPQGVHVADDGTVWVIDSGMGGEMQFTAADPASGGERPVTYGTSAQLVMVDAAGAQSTVAMLPSTMVGEGMGAEIAGGGRIAVMDGEVYMTVGEWQGSFSSERPEMNGAVVKLDGDGIVLVADTWANEEANNPDGFGLHSHPYGLSAGPDGMLYIVDAGGNALLRTDPATGEIETVAVFDGVPGMPFPNGGRGGAMESDPVPTDVVMMEDGTAFVSILPGFPFIPGSGKVVQVGADGSVSDYAMGLTMITDLVQGPDGALYGTQFGIFTEQGPQFGSGAIIRIQEGDASEVLVEGLAFPTAIDFDADGNGYVTINGVGAPGSGEVVKFAALTEM